VATGKGRRGLDEALAHSQLHGLFDATRTADETAGKPHPLMLQELMAELGAAARTHADDRRHHARPAAGAQRRHRQRGVSYGAHEPETFASTNRCSVAHSTRELHDWLLAHA
jgi:phosphoglycolate phosphatase